MSQNDFTIANQGFPAFRADLNSALQALASNSSGATAPSTTFSNMWWYDSANNIMYIRNEDNDAWIKFAELDQTNDKFVLSGTLQLDDGTVSAPALTFNSDTNMGIYRGGTDILKFVTAGTDAITIDASQNVDVTGAVTAGGLTVDTNADTSFGANSDSATTVNFKTNRSSANATMTNISSKWNEATVAQVRFETGSDTTNKDDGRISFRTSSSGASVKLRQLIENNGDISFYEDTGTTPKLFWDASAERLGIGTSSPNSLLDIKGSTGNSVITLNSATAIDAYPSIGKLRFFSNDSSTNSSGEVGSIETIGIGTWNGSQNIAVMTFNLIQGLAGTTSPVEAMRIDSSGNVLVGKTSLGAVGAGSGFGATGINYMTADGATTLRLNRETSDGEIVSFRKDNSTVGSIGTVSSRLHIENGDTGLRIAGDLDQIFPCGSGGSDRGDAIDLGSSGVRFKDLYLSGGVYLGGTASANQLDDYEEGTFTPTYTGSTTNPTITYDTLQLGRYTKIGRIVVCHIRIRTDAVSGGSGFLLVSSLPFTVSNTGDLLQIGNLVSDAFGSNDPHSFMAITNSTNAYLIYGNYGVTNVSDLQTGNNNNQIQGTLIYETA